MANKKKITTTVTTTVVEETVEQNNNNKTEIICVLDRSGSMGSIIQDAIGGFNSYIEEQKKLDFPTTVTVCLFDDVYEMLYDNVDLKDVKEITMKEWTPRGLTALYDAIGKSVNDRYTKIMNMPKEEKPNKVLVVIVTDGGENASKEYRHADVTKLIENKKKEDWQFIFLAANQDAFTVGTSFGISGGNTMNFVSNSKGVYDMSAKMSAATKMYRSVSMDSANYSDTVGNLFNDSDDVKRDKE